MSEPGKEEVIPMMESSSSVSRNRALPVLRVDLSRPSRTSGSTRTSVDYRYSQVSPKSPQLSADRFSVKFAPEVFSFQESDMDKVRFNKEKTTDGEDDEDETAAAAEEDEEEEEEEDEDYSASVSAILLRRASSRRQTKKRRRSSAFSPEGLELGLPRRRSSVLTTTSAETAISIEEGVTEEHIFQNIRLHKEVLSSVKQQPWPMRKKIKLVKQAKKYVKKHEGELQERLAQSKTTRDMLACCDIIFVKEWQFVKREIANLMNVMVPWELRIKEIESHFGSVVASYFTFLRWLFWVNLMISLILLTFVAIPEVFLADHKESGERKKPLPDETANSTKLMTLWDFEGVLKYSPLFYGYYNSKENSKTGYGYKGPLAYFITGIAVYIYSFVATLKRMAQNSRQSKLSEKDDECVFTWKLFTGWDYMIGNSETAHNRTASIILGFKEALLEEAEKKRDERSWKMLAIRALINLCVVGLFAFSVFAVVSVVKRSANPQNEDRRGWWKQNEVTIIVSLITNVFPFLFEILGSMERYHPRKRLRMQLGRIMVLNLLNLYTFIFASFSKINDKTVQLQKIKESLINMTMAASLALKSKNVTPTLATIANTIIDDSRGSHSTAPPLNCTRVLRCSSMSTPQSTSDFTSTSISSLATLFLLTSSSIGTAPTITEKNHTIVLPNKTAVASPDSFYNFTKNQEGEAKYGTEDYDNRIWNLLLPKTPSENNTRGKIDSSTFDSPGGFRKSSIFPSKNKSHQQTSNWLIDKIKIVVKSQYNVTDIDENNRTRSLDYDILHQIDYDDNIERNSTFIMKNDTYDDYDEFDEISTSTTYSDFENKMEETSRATDDGCYYVTVCTDWPYTSTSQRSDDVITTENLDQKSLTTLSTSTTKTTEIPTNVDFSLETHRLNITMRRVLRNLCWETVFGQELVKLTVMDLVLTIISTLMVDFIRALFVRVMNNCWCWDLEKKFPQYGDFKIAENILHLVNNQGMVWMGMFFSPGLPVINLIKLAIMMYLRSWAVLTCNVPHEVVFRASRSNNFYLALLLTMLFLCVLPVSYAIVWVEPSWHCGPFSNYPKIYYLFTNSTKNALPKELHHTLDYIASPGIVIPLLMLLILVIYYLISLTNSLREANNDLKVQLRRERTEERRKVFQMVDRKHRGDFSGDLIDNTPFHKWSKTLTILPNKASTDSPSEPVPVTDTDIAHAQNGNLKTDAKKLISKLTKHAKQKSCVDQEEKSLLIDDRDNDMEQLMENLPEDGNTHPIKSKHRSKQSEAPVSVHSRPLPAKKVDSSSDHQHNQRQNDQDVREKQREAIKHKKIVNDESPKKRTRKEKFTTGKQRQKGSASSASSEDVPEIVVTHQVRADDVNDDGKHFDQSKSSSFDTVIESGEYHKGSDTEENKKQGKKPLKCRKEKKGKSEKVEAPLRRSENNGDSEKDHLIETSGRRNREKSGRMEEKYSFQDDVNRFGQKEFEVERHLSKQSHGIGSRRREDSSSMETDSERIKKRKHDSNESHQKKKVDKKKSKKYNATGEETSGSKTDEELVALNKIKGNKKHTDEESDGKYYFTESSIEKKEKKIKTDKNEKEFEDNVLHSTKKNSKSKKIGNFNLDDENDRHFESRTRQSSNENWKKKSGGRNDSQKGEHENGNSHKFQDKKSKIDVINDETACKTGEREVDVIAHTDRDRNEKNQKLKKEIFNIGDDLGEENKKNKRKEKEKMTSKKNGYKQRTAKPSALIDLGDSERESSNPESRSIEKKNGKRDFSKQSDSHTLTESDEEISHTEDGKLVNSKKKEEDKQLERTAQRRKSIKRSEISSQKAKSQEESIEIDERYSLRRKHSTNEHFEADYDSNNSGWENIIHSSVDRKSSGKTLKDEKSINLRMKAIEPHTDSLLSGYSGSSSDNEQSNWPSNKKSNSIPANEDCVSAVGHREDDNNTDADKYDSTDKIPKSKEKQGNWKQNNRDERDDSNDSRSSEDESETLNVSSG